MKIGIILLSKGFAGAERVVYNLAKEFSNSNKNRIYLMLNDEIFDYYSDLNNVKIFNLGIIEKRNRLLNLFTYYKIRRAVRKIIRKFRLEIINSHMDISNFVSPPSYNKIPIFHGSDLKILEKSPSIPYSIFILPRIKKSLDRSSILISVSNGLVEEIPEKYKGKTVVIPNGVDSKVFKPLKNIKQKKNVVLFVGRFIDIKGIREIIHVAKQLSQYEFWFAGQGELWNLINLPNTKNLGFRTTEELVKLYNQATICIQPSYREGSPLCGLEAMACGRAVIATPLGFSEYIENGKDGIIIPAKDEVALKNAIINLMINEKKRKMLEKNARKKALQYSWEKSAEQYLEVYNKVLNNKTPPSAPRSPSNHPQSASYPN